VPVFIVLVPGRHRVPKAPLCCLNSPAEKQLQRKPRCAANMCSKQNGWQGRQGRQGTPPWQLLRTCRMAGLGLRIIRSTRRHTALVVVDCLALLPS